MISRVWCAWTAAEKADAYESFLLKEVFPQLRNAGHAGLEGIDLFRRQAEREIEFMTVIWFASPEALRAFAGDSERAVVAETDKSLVTRYEEMVRHYDVRSHIRLRQDNPQRT